MAPQRINLEPHREWITAQIKAGATLQHIICHLPQDGPSVSLNSLKRRLNAWGVSNTRTGPLGQRSGKRQHAGLESARPWIIESYLRWDRLNHIRSEIKQRVGIDISERSLHFLLHDLWEIPPRGERCNTPEIREYITRQVELKAPVSEIKQSLHAEYGICKTTSWIYQQLSDWDVKLPARFEDMDEEDLQAVKRFIKNTFYECRQTDKDIKEWLEGRGYSISLAKIARLRKEMELKRVHTPEEADEVLNRLREAMRACQPAGILVPRLTKMMLPMFFKNRFHLPISRAMAWRFMHEEYPEDMLTRVRTVARKRGGYLCPGPNYIWSIDAYCKLAHWGIEIYACIDAYSRYVVWAHVGHTAQTQRSVCLQYVDTIRTTRYLPLVIRSDHGVETGMIAGAHYWLSAASKGSRLSKPTRDDEGRVVWIYREVADGVETRHVVPADPEHDIPHPTFAPEQPLEFRDCYSYGVSTKNQRIESWWSQLNYHLTQFWRVSCLLSLCCPRGPLPRPHRRIDAREAEPKRTHCLRIEFNPEPSEPRAIQHVDATFTCLGAARLPDHSTMLIPVPP